MKSCIGIKNSCILRVFNLPLNPEATALWRSHFTKDKYAFGHDDFVVGPAIVIQKDALNTWAN